MTNAWLGINQICNCRGKELGDMTLVRTSFEDLIDFSDLRIRARWQDFNQTGLICPCSLRNNQQITFVLMAHQFFFYQMFCYLQHKGTVHSKCKPVVGTYHSSDLCCELFILFSERNATYKSNAICIIKNSNTSLLIIYIYNPDIFITKAENTVKNVLRYEILQFKITVFNCNNSLNCNSFLWCKAEFSVFSVTWSFRIHSNMLICCSIINCILLSMLKTVVMLNRFLETVIHFFQDSLNNIYLI